MRYCIIYIMPLPPDLSKPAFSIYPIAADRVMCGLCVTCASPKITNNDFRDALGRAEYSISGMCQKCQDDVYAVGGDEEMDWNSADELFE